MVDGWIGWTARVSLDDESSDDSVGNERMCDRMSCDRMCCDRMSFTRLLIRRVNYYAYSTSVSDNQLGCVVRGCVVI